MSRRVLVELSPQLDLGRWAAEHARGEVPDRLPYGLDRLAAHDLDVTCRSWPAGRRARSAGRAAARRLGGLLAVESVLGRPSPRSADVRLCWDERLGIPALLDPRSRHRPVISGVIWLTDSDQAPPRHVAALARRALQRADALFVLSTAQVPVLRDDWAVPEERITYVPFGVDTDFWDPAAAPPLPGPAGPTDGVPPAGRRVLGVGNDRHRAHDVLIEAVRQVRGELPDVRLDLMTGRDVAVPEAVGVRHGRLPHARLRDHYATADVVAVATRENLHASGITTALEAMAMGRPVVASDTGGMDDYVEHGTTGLLVPPGDPRALADAVRLVLQDPDLAAALGSAGRERALARFSTRAQAARFAAIVERL